MGCNFMLDHNERCDAKYELKYLLFRDPNSRDSKEISICPRHFGETIDESLILPLKRLFYKRDNLYAKDKREKAIARRNDVILLPTRRTEIDDIKEQIRKQLGFKCANVICGTSISTLNPVHSMMVISHLGRVSYKFYFCSKVCFDKMKIRTGALLPKIRKEIPIQEFF